MINKEADKKPQVEEQVELTEQELEAIVAGQFGPGGPGPGYPPFPEPFPPFPEPEPPVNRLF
jgi:hypothetical protein